MAQITSENLRAMFTAFKTQYHDTYDKVPSYKDKVAMVMPSFSREETYAWIGQFLNLHEWIGERYVKKLEASGFTIKNRKFESTVEISREVIEDDRAGLYGPVIKEMGLVSRQHPDELIFGLLGQGFGTECYDGQYFFDVDHPVLNSFGLPVSVSNVQAGSGEPWFLLDTSRAVRPLIWQERIPYKFQALNHTNDDIVFMLDVHLYGVRARANAGLGFWQFAHGSKADLNAANYEAARQAMMNFRSDGKRPLGVRPTVMVVPPRLEGAAMRLLNAATNDGGHRTPTAVRSS